MKKLITILILIALIVILVFVFGNKKEINDAENNNQTTITNTEGLNDTNTVKMSYTNGTDTVIAIYNNTNNTVTFSINNTRENTLPIAISGSGARYANEDESLVFWEHQNEITITKNGVDVFKGGEKK